MAEDTPQQDRTEAATPRRMQRAREEGRVPVSREVQLFSGLAAVTLVLSWSAGTVRHDLTARLPGSWHTPTPRPWPGPRGCGSPGPPHVHGAAPFILAALAAGVAAALLQTGFLLHGGMLQPDLQPHQPARRPAPAVLRDHLMEALKSIAKIAVWLHLWHVLRADLPAAAAGAALGAAGPAGAHPVARAAHAVRGAGAAGGDRGARPVLGAPALRAATAHEQGGCAGRAAGDRGRPEDQGSGSSRSARNGRASGCSRRCRRPRSWSPTRRTMPLPWPTTGRSNAAPRVVAKGVDSLAARIREVAQANQVPLVANPPLAQALYRVEVDTEIPAEHYQAVAELIAYVWRLGQRQRRTRRVA